MQSADCYKILGVPVGAPTEEVTAAYKKLSEKFNPDANAGDSFFRERFKDVQEACQTLINPTESSHQTTDQQLHSEKNTISAVPYLSTSKSMGKQLAGAPTCPLSTARFMSHESCITRLMIISTTTSLPPSIQNAFGHRDFISRSCING